MSRAEEIGWLVFVGLGLGLNAVVWTRFLIIRWSRPRARKWEGKPNA